MQACSGVAFTMHTAYLIKCGANTVMQWSTMAKDFVVAVEGVNVHGISLGLCEHIGPHSAGSTGEISVDKPAIRLVRPAARKTQGSLRCGNRVFASCRDLQRPAAD